MAADPDGAGGLLWRLETIARTARGEPMPPPPRSSREPEPEPEESEAVVWIRGLIEEAEREMGIVPKPDQSLAMRLAMAIPWDEMELENDGSEA
jgi:hypothetical protein